MRVFTCRRPKYWCDPVMFSPDGRYLACFKNPACQSVSSSVLYAWHTTEADDRELRGMEMPKCDALAFDANSTGVYFVRHGDSVRRGDLTTWRGEADPFLSAFLPHTISADGRLALAEKHEVVASNFPTGTLALRAARHNGKKWIDSWKREFYFNPAHWDTGYTHLLFSTGGRFVVRVHIVDEEARVDAWTEVQLIDAETGKPRVLSRVTPAWRGYLPRPPSKAVAGPTGVLALAKGKTFYAFDPNVPDAPVVKRTNSSTQHFTDLAFAPDGRRLATVSRDKAVTLWDTTTWEVVRQYEWKIGALRSVCFAPDGLRCAAGSETGQVVVWDLDD